MNRLQQLADRIGREFASRGETAAYWAMVALYDRLEEEELDRAYQRATADLDDDESEAA
jgi:hypothetical protein